MDLREKAKRLTADSTASLLAWADQDNLQDCVEAIVFMAMEDALEWAAEKCIAQSGALKSNGESVVTQWAADGCAIAIRTEAARLRKP